MPDLNWEKLAQEYEANQERRNSLRMKKKVSRASLYPYPIRVNRYNPANGKKDEWVPKTPEMPQISETTGESNESNKE